jgi:hypothetical protein
MCAYNQLFSMIIYENFAIKSYTEKHRYGFFEKCPRKYMLRLIQSKCDNIYYMNYIYIYIYIYTCIKN